MDNVVRFLGWRDDVPEIMCCSDWFILPHPEHPVEGFGLAIVEAQLAGLRMLLSRGILDDPLLPTASFRRLALSDGPKLWAKAAMELLHHPVPSRAAALAALRESPFEWIPRCPISSPCTRERWSIIRQHHPERILRS